MEVVSEKFDNKWRSKHYIISVRGKDVINVMTIPYFNPILYQLLSLFFGYHRMVNRINTICRINLG